MQLVFNPIWSWWQVACVVIGMLVMVLWVYPKRVRHLSVFYRRLLVGLRLAAVAVLTAAMMRPAIQWKDTDKSASSLMILIDSSRSTNTQDGPGGISRRVAMLKTLEENSDLFDTLKKKVDIRYFDFAESLTPTENPQNNAKGNQTAIGFTLARLLEENSGNRIAGVILLSDGAERSLSKENDPRAKAREYGQRGTPIYTIGYGTAGLSETLDLSVEDLLIDPLVFEKKTVPISARIRVQGAAGRKLTVRLLVENREGIRPGEPGKMVSPKATRKTIATKQIEPSENSEVFPVELSFIPQQPGELKIAVEVVPLKDELKDQNNRLETLITVQKGGINIAYFNHPLSTEQKFLRAMNSSDKIQVEFHDVRTGGLSRRTEIDPEIFEPNQFDAFIIGNISASAFGKENLQRLAKRVQAGAGLMMTGGVHSFGPGGYANTPLAELLPVSMRRSAAGNTSDSSLHITKDTPMQPTAQGLQHFVMRLDPKNNKKSWASLAPLNGANRLRPKRGALVQILAVSAEADPLLLFHEVGQSRVMAFAADSTYRWYLDGKQELHQRFWRQIILYLARKEFDTDQKIWARVDPRNFAPRQLVPITFGAQDENGIPIPDAEYVIEVMNPSGEKQSIPAQLSSNGNTAVFADSKASGDYWVRVAAGKGGNPLGFDGWTRFIVDSRDLELDNPAANPTLLEEIAILSGGNAIPPEELGDFLNRMIEGKGIALSEFTKLHQTTLWDNWFFLSLFVLLMTLEWIIRKLRGLV